MDKRRALLVKDMNFESRNIYAFKFDSPYQSKFLFDNTWLVKNYDKEVYDRDAMKRFLDMNSIKYKKRCHTKTLKKLLMSF